jgi:hypothetical protein
MDFRSHFDNDFRKKWFDFMIAFLLHRATIQNLSQFTIEHNWYLLGKNPNIDFRIIQNHTKKDWDYWFWYSVSANPNITMEMILSNPDLPWVWAGVTENPNLPIKYVIDNPDLSWNWNMMSYNPELTIAIIEMFPDKDWSCPHISQHKNVTIDVIKQYPEIPWSLYYIELNPNITVDIMKTHPNYPWHWSNIFYNENTTIDYIKNNMDLPWDWENIVFGTDVTVEEIRNNPELLKKISNDVTIQSLLENPNYPQSYWNYISMHKNITMNDIQNNLNLPWNWDCVGNNPNLTVDFICKNMHSEIICYWNGVYTNELAIDKKHFIAHQTKNVNLLQMHIFFNANTDKVVKPIEYALFDNYLLKQILQY